MKDTIKESDKRLRKLFFTQLQISTCTFGGGFVIVQFMQRKYVEQLQWLEESEMPDLTALAQSAPGAIAVNAAVLVGTKVAGIRGATVAVLATVLPPMVIIGLLSLAYAAFAQNRLIALFLHGMQACIAAIILDAAYSLGKSVAQHRRISDACIFLSAFVATFVFHVNVVYILLAAAVIGILHVLIQHQKAVKM